MTRLLSVTAFPPRLDAMHGGGRVTAELLTRLAKRHPVALLCLRAPGEPPVDEALAEHCELVLEIARPPWAGEGRHGLLTRLRGAAALLRAKPLWATEMNVRELRRAIGEVCDTWRPDVVQIEYDVMGQYLNALPARLPSVLVIHDPGVCRNSRTDGRWRQALLSLDSKAWRSFEPRVLGLADAVVVFSERDRERLQPMVQQGRLHVIPITVPTPAKPLDPRGNDGEILFVGNFIHPPNVDAARVLVEELLPRIRSMHPGTVAYIVGDSPPRWLLEKNRRSGVVVTGRVPSVEPFLDRAAVVVAPLRYGGGMRVKVLEALAAGKALVATPLAAAGLEVTSGEQLVLAEGSDELATAVSSLLSHSERREQLAAGARAWALRQPGWDDIVGEYERLYLELLAPGSAPR